MIPDLATLAWLPLTIASLMAATVAAQRWLRVRSATWAFGFCAAMTLAVGFVLLSISSHTRPIVSRTALAVPIRELVFAGGWLLLLYIVAHSGLWPKGLNMQSVKIPGSAWVIALAIVNALPAALSSAYPNAVWVPLVVDLLLVVAKAIEVYRPKQGAFVPPAALAQNYVAAEAPQAPAAQPGRLQRFFLGG